MGKVLENVSFSINQLLQGGKITPAHIRCLVAQGEEFLNNGTSVVPVTPVTPSKHSTKNDDDSFFMSPQSLVLAAIAIDQLALDGILLDGAVKLLNGATSGVSKGLSGMRFAALHPQQAIASARQSWDEFNPRGYMHALCDSAAAGMSAIGERVTQNSILAVSLKALPSFCRACALRVSGGYGSLPSADTARGDSDAELHATRVVGARDDVRRR